MFSFRTPVKCVAVLLAVIVILPVLARAAGTTQATTKPVIAVFQLKGALSEQPGDEQLALFGPPPQSLGDVVQHMKKAAKDPAVTAVVLLADEARMGFAQTEEMRQAIQRLRTAGKDVYAHSDSMLMDHYLLLSGASRLSISPTGDLWLTGLYGDQIYLHGLLSKLGIEADFLHCGAYKSASEIFMRDGPSPEADAMENWLFDSIYQTSIQLIASGRNVSEDKVRGWINGGPYLAEQAKTAGMIDAVETRADLETFLKDRYGKDVVFAKQYGEAKKPELNLSNPFAVLSVFAQMMGGQATTTRNQPGIGIIHVDGMILLGQRDSSPFATASAASTDIARALDQAADDDSIKAVVLRIDSPGGSATGSEIILRAAQRLKSKKPLVVSMGNVAGSGGYYVACAADTIFADRATITASIGVVSGKFATTGMWNKIGVTFKPYSRGDHAGMLSSDAVFTPAERDQMQAYMNTVYGVFKDHVTAIRGNRLKKPIDDLAAGRVFTGQQAIDLGLVDKIGTMQDAIEYAATQVKMADYDVRTVPEPKNFFQRLMEQTAGGDDDPNHLTTSSVSAGASDPDGLLKLAAPYLADLDPGHVQPIRTALRELQLVQKEGVIMMMTPPSCGESTRR